MGCCVGDKEQVESGDYGLYLDASSGGERLRDTDTSVGKYTLTFFCPPR